ncbi:S9 family peptidase [Paractinoplanes ferrugineus]|uniref:S9 family peptidase n=1 Tax=Paractinoplanes ferrugineus TaxID=113564 RepID=UPI001EF22B4B|nr:prolyl oligopeptidase family serine peptidase [Actinoplanes ferrugineus]
MSDRGGRPQVWVQQVGTGMAFRVDTGDAPVAQVLWSTGGGWLACLSAPGGGPRHEVWLVRPDGSGLHQVAGFGTDAADNMRWLPGRSQLVVTENLTTALLIEPASGTRTVVGTGELITLLDFFDGTALLRMGPRGSRHVVERSLATGTDRFVAIGEQAVFGPDGIIMRSEVDELPRLVTTGRLLAASDRAEVESFALAPDGSRVAVLWNVWGGTSSIEVISLSDEGRETVPMPGLVAADLTWSADGRTLGFAAEKPGQPSGIWVYADGAVQPVSVAPAAPDAVEPTLEFYSAHDELGLSGWLFRPAGDGPFPTVLWFHGGPEDQERPRHGPLFQALVARGIAVFAPNVRGSSGFGRSFVNADNGRLRYAGIEDVRSSVRFLVFSGVADPARIGCMGRSYGGYLTLIALTWFPDLFRAGIDVCGMSDFATFYEHTEPWIAAAAVSKYGDPKTDAALLADLSPMTRIDDLRAPLMLIHGENDTNVPVIESAQVAAALSAREIPHRYLLFPDEGHQLLNQQSRADYLQETIDWLSKYLL